MYAWHCSRLKSWWTYESVGIDESLLQSSERIGHEVEILTYFAGFCAATNCDKLSDYRLHAHGLCAAQTHRSTAERQCKRPFHAAPPAAKSSGCSPASTGANVAKWKDASLHSSHVNYCALIPILKV